MFRWLLRWLNRWTERQICAHHWHPIGTIDWCCCWCDRVVDGPPPADKTDFHHPDTPRAYNGGVRADRAGARPPRP